jgi:transcriptional regulator with XRE-family HTH domain
MPDTFAPRLIARLALLCDASGLTRSDIAGRSGILPGDLSRLLSGRRDPAVSSVARILEAIGEPWAALDDD